MPRARVASTAEVAPANSIGVQVGGVPVCLARDEAGDWYALSNVCSHERFPLAGGEILNGAIECSRHGSRFSLRTGRALNLPAVEPVPAYAVTIEGEDVYVEV